MVVFDFSRLSTPYRMKRCSYQLLQMALIAEDLHQEVVCLVTRSHLDQHPFLKRAKRLWSPRTRSGAPILPDNIDVYIAKSDAYYRDENWADVSKLSGYKVCLCNSDRCFRESSKAFRLHRGHPVQDRADLYMPANHTPNLLETHAAKVIPAAHPVDPRMSEFFYKNDLYYHYLRDDVEHLRSAFETEEVGVAGFMGNSAPVWTRRGEADNFPDWAEFNWKRAATPRAYIKWVMGRQGCIDMRGNGDKSLRFTEAAMFGRTIIAKRLPSVYSPPLVDNHNCILVDDWDELHGRYDRAEWERLAVQSTIDYRRGWSLRAQIKTILTRAGIDYEDSFDNGDNRPDG